MAGGGGGKQETEAEPWQGIQPYLYEGYGAARERLREPQQYFPGQTYVGFAPETEQALALQTERAQSNPLLGLGQEQAAATLQGDYLGQNPYLDQLQDSVLSSVAPQVYSQFGGASGRFGSPAMAEALGRGVSRGMSPYLFSEYGAERGRQMEASRMAPGLSAADYMDIEQLGAVGAQRENLERLALQDEISRFNFAQQEPRRRVQEYMAILGGSAPLIGGAGQTVAQSPGGGLSAGGAASGAAGGALAGTAIMPGWGTAIGALGGGLMGSGLLGGGY